MSTDKENAEENELEDTEGLQYGASGCKMRFHHLPDDMICPDCHKPIATKQGEG